MHILSWNFLFDISLLTIILYSLYKTLRMTGTWKIVIGLTSAGILASIARFFDLQGIDWLFSNFSHIIIIVLVIIFQPEIRKIFERSMIIDLVNKTLFPFFRRQDKQQISTAELLSKIVFELAARKWGGLIVIPGKQSLKGHIKGGTKADASLSLSLLLSIFDDSSPGHDGAVLVEKGKISRFGVHLPLSSSNKLDENYGTRHHAAMGLSENSDALILLVSEERGTVSYFKNAKMKRIPKQEDVIEIINTHLTGGALKPSGMAWYKRFLVTSSEVVACLMVAVLFWTTLVHPKTEIKERLYTVPIEYTKTDKNIQVIQGQREAKILLAGPETLLNRVNPLSLQIKVDLQNFTLGRHDINITSEHIEIPRNVKIVQIQPERLSLDLQYYVVREAKIRPQLLGSLPTGSQLTSMTVTPDTLSVIDKRKSKEESEIIVTTTPIYLDNIQRSTTVYCKIILPKDIQLENNKLTDAAVGFIINGEKLK